MLKCFITLWGVNFMSSNLRVSALAAVRTDGSRQHMRREQNKQATQITVNVTPKLLL